MSIEADNVLLLSLTLQEGAVSLVSFEVVPSRLETDAGREKLELISLSWDVSDELISPGVTYCGDPTALTHIEESNQ